MASPNQLTRFGCGKPASLPPHTVTSRGQVMQTMCYGVRQGGVLVRCFTSHADAVAFAADILENWWGELAVEWYPY